MALPMMFIEQMPRGERKYHYFGIECKCECGRKACTASEMDYGEYCCRSCAETGKHSLLCDGYHVQFLRYAKESLEVGDSFVGLGGPPGVVIEVLPGGRYLLQGLWKFKGLQVILDSNIREWGL